MYVKGKGLVRCKYTYCCLESAVWQLVSFQIFEFFNVFEILESHCDVLV